MEVNAENTSINAWCISPNFTSVFENYGYSNVIDGDTNITLREIGGTANEIITVGAYTSKNNYTDFLGINHDANFYGEIGEIAPFSSRGPTVDGRMKPDITAPGNIVVSSVNSFDTNFLYSSPTVVKGVTDGLQEWWYATLEGTSMAAPVVTGIIALWLEAKPDLTVNDIKNILNNTAIHDSFTGNANNNIWGRGKIDAWLAMLLIEQALTIETNDELKKITVYPNPTNDIINIITTENYSDIKLYNALGQQVTKLIIKNTERGHSLDLSKLNSGVYYLLIINGNGIKNAKIIKN